MNRRFVIHYRVLDPRFGWSKWYYDRKSQRLLPHQIAAVDTLNYGHKGETTVFGWKNIHFRVTERKDSPGVVS